MADSGFGKLLLLGGAGVAAYYLFLRPSTATAQATGTPQPSGGATPAAQPAAPAKPPLPYNTLDQIYQRLVQSLQLSNVPQQQGNFMAKATEFNYFLGRVGPNLSDQGMGEAFPGGDVQMTLPQFWGPASAWLAQNKGLSGIGGRGLAGIIASRGRRA